MANPIGFQKDEQGYWIIKDPNASKDYTIDYSKWLIDGDVITGVVWNVPAPLVSENEGISGGNTKVFVQLSGGEYGGSYPITAHITTAEGRSDDFTFRLIMRET